MNNPAHDPRSVFDLTGKRILVTGASMGLGKRFGWTLARAGAEVILAARSEDKLRELADSIAAFGGKCVCVALDVRDRAAIRDTVASIEQAGPIDVLVNNAGIAIVKAPERYQDDDWDNVYETNLRGPWVLAQAIIRNSAEYYPIYAEREFTYNKIKQGNRNALLYTDPSVDGLKTGHTEEAGYCLTASAKRNGLRLISVIMNTSSAQARADQTRVLFNWGFANFEQATPAQPGASLTAAKLQYGVVPEVAAGVDKPWKLVIAKGQGASLKTAVTLNPGLEAPIAKGAVIGKVVASLNGKPVGEAPLVALAGVERAGFFQRIGQRISGWFSK